MDGMKELIKNYKESELDYSLVFEYLNEETITPIIKYERSLDSLRVFFAANPKHTVVFYSDKAVALIVDIQTNKVVGLQVDNFEKGFLPEFIASKKIGRRPSIKQPSTLKPLFSELCFA